MVLVRDGCGSSARSRRLAARLQATSPGTPIRVINIDTDLDHAAPLPVPLVGTPMWVLEGRIAWLGTPDPAEVLCRLDARASYPGPGEDGGAEG